MKYEHEFHSMCFLTPSQIYVTGSRSTNENADKSCELYDVNQDKWVDMPPMNNGRNRHSSCGFANKWVYVFCGMVDRQRSKTIERLDTSAAQQLPWENLEVTDNNQREARFCPGVYQIDASSIAIFGGFGKERALKDYFKLDVNQNTVDLQNKSSDIGMEMYFKNVQRVKSGELIFSSDANCFMYRVSGDATYNDYLFDYDKTSELVDEDD